MDALGVDRDVGYAIERRNPRLTFRADDDSVPGEDDRSRGGHRDVGLAGIEDGDRAAVRVVDGEWLLRVDEGHPVFDADRRHLVDDPVERIAPRVRRERTRHPAERQNVPEVEETRTPPVLRHVPVQRPGVEGQCQGLKPAVAVHSPLPGVTPPGTCSRRSEHP